MNKEKAEKLRKKYKDDKNIDYSDIPELTDEILATGKVIPARTYLPDE